MGDHDGKEDGAMISKQLLIGLLEKKNGMGTGYDFDQVMSDIRDFPDEPDKDRHDHICLDMALESPVWMATAAREPRREIDVHMTYADLMCIYRRLSYQESGG